MDCVGIKSKLNRTQIAIFQFGCLCSSNLFDTYFEFCGIAIGQIESFAVEFQKIIQFSAGLFLLIRFEINFYSMCSAMIQFYTNLLLDIFHKLKIKTEKKVACCGFV